MRGEDGVAECVGTVRRFSRFYTRRIGLLHEGLLGGELSLTQGRVVYELAQRGTATATELKDELDLDAGYLSRLLREFEARRLIEKRGSTTDGRRVLLTLTDQGRGAFAAIDARSQAEVTAMVASLSPADRGHLGRALTVAEHLLGGEGPGRPPAPFVLRPPQAGDLGWIVHRQAVLYAREYGWDETFEALIAGIVAEFGRSSDPARERCWIAERDGEVLGSVFLVRDTDALAKLRLLYVEPAARGVGLGRRLVDTCVGFARDAGYAKVTLWTNDVLAAARRIYRDAGFRLVTSERHRSFGHELVGERWELDLAD